MKEGKEDRVTRITQNHSQMCRQNYSGAHFIASIQDPIMVPSMAPGPAGAGVGELRGSYGSSTLQLRLQSGH